MQKNLSQQAGTNLTPQPTKVFALGGLEEIGKNTYCIEHNEELIIIDAGVKFPSKQLLGVSAVIPNYQYLKDNETKIKALFITHGHEDHIGGIPYLLKQVNIKQIYAPLLATALIEERLKEFALPQKPNMRSINSESIIRTKNFIVSFFAVNHSIPDAFGLAIYTPNGLFVTTGDYKFDWTPLGHNFELEKLAQMGREGVKLLMADSTNAEISGYTITEQVIVDNLRQLFVKAPGRILFSTFASNVHRIQKILEITSSLNRKILVIGRSLDKIIKIIYRMGHLNINKDVFVTKKSIKKYNKNLVIICTGSQGENLAALSRIANNEHADIKIQQNDTVILSSSAIPGNYESVQTLVNNLIFLGATVYENDANFKIHSSGHASQEEQKLLFKLLKPQFFFPMHGDFRMLKCHKDTAVSTGLLPENVFLCANGDQLNIQGDKAWIGKRINAEPVYVDGAGISSESAYLVRDRDSLSRDGLIAVVITIDTKSNSLISDPKIISRGCFYVSKNSSLIWSMMNIVKKKVQEALSSKKPTFSLIKIKIKEGLSPFIYNQKRRNPLIIPVILNKI